ncbi:prolipoprotein diacylglyceryl transferase [Actinacidiphila rubida]|uniref:Uncharacterized protein n=1 Tax=Actinacidiphila rubida TaxID=310780 RepID=A0A1H8L8P4_9ACTN|nr:hypothetical protein [Actinacidiphila rubida]SEO01554.1 hypothetical protein SAMN05216267_1015104 [Actinacidiphila rubida]
MTEPTPVEPNQALTAFMAAVANEPDDTKATLLRAAAVVKQKEASDLLDQADLLDHEASLRGAVEEAHERLAAAMTAVDPASDAVKTALVDERAAEDRLAEAVEHERQAAEAEEVARLEDADPAVQTDTIIRLNAAREVTARRRAVVENARGVRQNAQTVLALAHEAVKSTRSDAKAAQDALSNADATVTVSDATILIDWARRLSNHTSGAAPLTDDRLAAVEGAVDGFARTLGLDRKYVRQGREKLQTEILDARKERLLPKPGHSLRPADAGQIFMPVQPPLSGR